MSLPHRNAIFPANGSPIYFHGPSLDEGLKPAVIYFALSAQTSLFEDPINQPVVRLIQAGIRVFSWDLPFHARGDDPHAAMRHWAKEFIHNPAFLSDFLALSQRNIYYLFKRNLIEGDRLAVAGLSRGAFIATHFAAMEPHFKFILGFAPMTKPKTSESDRTSPQENFTLNSLAEHLYKIPLRFHIGNHDELVGTDACYSFIRTLTDTAISKGIRSPQVELMIYPSIGFKGHGTPPHIFNEGADWIKRQFQKGEAV